MSSWSSSRRLVRPLRFTSLSGYFLQLRPQLPQRRDNLLALVLVRPRPPHRRQLPPVLQPVQQVDVRLQVRDVVAQILRLAILGLDLLPLLQVLGVEVLDTLEPELGLELRLLRTRVALEVQRGLELRERVVQVLHLG